MHHEEPVNVFAWPQEDLRVHEKIRSTAQENMHRCGEWQLRAGKEYSQDLFPRVLQFIREYSYYCMKPLWSNKEISLPIAGIESETEMLRVAELLRYILRFHFTFMAGAWGLKMCLPLLSIIQANTLKQIYNSTTGELIQFIGAGVFFSFSPPYFFYFFLASFLLSVERCCIYSLISQARLAPDIFTTQLYPFSDIRVGGYSTHMPQFNYLTDLQREGGGGLFIQLSSLSSPPSVSD